ncbi:hypothetical protein LTR27_003387 [Elasticomyces elasticus]|nr:hypothetical protein LTR27_003387 [Elasticomyces elasticus]
MQGSQIMVAVRPWSTKDFRDNDTRYESICAHLRAVGVRYDLNFGDLHPWNNPRDLGPFDSYFGQGHQKPGSVSPFVTSWLEKDHRGTASRFPAVREILNDHKDCEYAIAALVDAIAVPPHGHFINEPLTVLEALRARLLSIRARLHDLTSTSPFHEVYFQDQNSKACSRLFAIPEMVEHIFKFADTRDVVRAQQVCKAFFNIVKTSYTLQRKLGLQVDTAGFHSLPLRDPHRSNDHPDFPRFRCSSLGSSSLWFEHFRTCLEELTTQSTPPLGLADVRVHASIEATTTGRLPAVSELFRSMLICQPPIKSMSMSLICCPDPAGGRNNYDLDLRSFQAYLDANGTTITHPIVTSSGPGLTLGEVWDAAQKLIRREEWYSGSGEELFEPGHRDFVRVEFEGSVRVRYDDPVIVWHMDQAPNERRVHDELAKAEGEEEKRQAETTLKKWTTHKQYVQAYLQVMGADMRDRKNRTPEELQVAWSAFRDTVRKMQESELEDAETVSEGHQIGDSEST